MRYTTQALRTVSFAALLMAATPVLAADLDIVHWMTSASESAAIGEIAKIWEAQGNTWTETAVAGGSEAIAVGVNRIAGGDAPTAMTFNTGRQFEDLVKQGLLADIEGVAAADGWRDFIPQVLVDASTADGKFYAAPINVHGENWLYYNKGLFAEVGAPTPDTWEAFFEAADKLKAAGKIALAHGGEAWQERVTFNTVLSGIGGKDLFLKVYRDHDVEAINSPLFREVAETFIKMRDYTDEGLAGRSWNDAANLVISGSAGMFIMGDWAKGEFTAAGKVADVDYGCIVGPGEAFFQIGGDVLVFPKINDAEKSAVQQQVAALVVSPEAQAAFNDKKGSLPVRADVDTSKLDACAQKGLGILYDVERQVPGYNFVMSSNLGGAVQDVISQFWNDRSMTVDAFISSIATTVTTVE
jgi:glucose/mannose transport system substrate-binding protein